MAGDAEPALEKLDLRWVTLPPAPLAGRTTPEWSRPETGDYSGVVPLGQRAELAGGDVEAQDAAFLDDVVPAVQAQVAALDALAHGRER